MLGFFENEARVTSHTPTNGEQANGKNRFLKARLDFFLPTTSYRYFLPLLLE